MSTTSIKLAISLTPSFRTSRELFGTGIPLISFQTGYIVITGSLLLRNGCAPSQTLPAATSLSEPRPRDTCEITIIGFIYKFTVLSILNITSRSVSCISTHRTSLTGPVRCVMSAKFSFLICTTLLLSETTLIMSSPSLTTSIAFER